MRLLLVVAIIIIAKAATFAQKPPIKFGDVPIEEIQMKVYEKDSSAAAVVLTDFGESTIAYSQSEGFQLIFQRIKRVKILTKDGLDQGDFSIQLYHDGDSDEKLINLKGITYNLENGKVVESKLKNDAQFKEKYSSNLNLVKFTMPNVKEGSVIEISYRVVSDFIFNFQDWEFQSTIPVVWSEYRANVPEYYNYEKYMQGYLPVTVNEQSTSLKSIVITTNNRTDNGGTGFSSDKIDYMLNTNRWVVENAPAFKEEAYITSYQDFISKINFELSFTKFPNRPINKIMGSWEDINKSYVESSDFGGEIKGNGFLKKTADEVTATINSPEEKALAIHAFVRNNFTWSGSYRKFTENPLRKIFDDKKGSSAELNLLMGSMLEKIGLEVYPVLISTRNNGFIREMTPVSSQFNYSVILAKIGDKQYLLDVTEKLLPFGMLPERCLNGKGFVVSKAGHSWVGLSAPERSRLIYSVEGKLTEEASLEGKLTLERTGYFAARDRKQYLAKEETEYVKNLTDVHQIEVLKSEFSNANELAKSFKEVHDVVATDRANVATNTIYFNPVFFNKVKENPFKSEDRKYPVDFGLSFDQMYILKLTIPDGYVVDEAPQPKVIGLPDGAGRFTYSFTQMGNTISLINNLQINKSVFNQVEYASLREFYNQVVAKQAEQVVLKKK
ncbi:DUF3857 domain-containing protein [Chryseotalea sanaruensis]|uniref:DUF3857 domain-containing protein n=1 Tax=Chryseotalea sanaruensis TaxID=2482724 RepID=A0A401U8E9_9BACT|nr:transglutaminase domain-containing protein [Chryseotalea sanaruensis]GCC51159.1 DUF3857 domain-containing protein [Chryseotalea sanaruensis]